MMSNGAGSLLGIYLAISICVVVFDLFVILGEKPKKRMLQQRKKNLHECLNLQATLIYEGKSLSERHQKQLRKQLRRVEDLLIFSEFADQYLSDKNPYFLKYLQLSVNLFQSLTEYYQRKSVMHRATYAWVLSRIGIDIPGTQGFLLDCIMERSIYCRENALTALYCRGNIRMIIEAFQRMSINQISHSAKLLCDGLLSCPVDKGELCAALWKNLDKFSANFQLAIIDVMRLSGQDYSEELLKLLKEERTDDELAYAILRYFGKIHYLPARDIMLTLVENPRREQWEYAAIAATALRNYPNKTVISVLLQALKSKTWYVRYNAAESLVAMNLPADTFQGIWQGNDRYAKEILYYMMNDSKIARQQKEMPQRQEVKEISKQNSANGKKVCK